MFFLFNKNKNKKVINRPINKINVNRNFKIFLLSTNQFDIRNFILPMHFIFKNWEAFLMVYKMQTLRNYPQMKKQLSIFLLKKNYQTFLLPSKTIQHLVKFLFMVKIPFHFCTTGKNTSGALINTVSIIGQLYATVRLNYYNGILQQTQHK